MKKYTKRFKKTEGITRVRAVSLNVNVEYVANVWHRNKNNDESKIVARFIGCGPDEFNLEPIVPNMKNTTGNLFLFFKNHKGIFKYEIKAGACFTTDLEKNKRVTFGYDEHSYKSNDKEHQNLEDYKFDIELEKARKIPREDRAEYKEGYSFDNQHEKELEEMYNFVRDNTKHMDWINEENTMSFVYAGFKQKIRKNDRYDINDFGVRKDSKFDINTYLALRHLRKDYMSWDMTKKAIFFLRLNTKVSFKQMDTWIRNSTKKNFNKAISDIKSIMKSIHVYDEESDMYIDDERGTGQVRDLMTYSIIAVLPDSYHRIMSQYHCFKTSELLIKNIEE